MMLFRTLSVQLFLAYIFLLLPGMLGILIVAIGASHSGPAATVLVAVMSIHASLDYLVLCYVVVPYRRAIWKVVTGLMRKEGSKVIVLSTG